MAEIVREAESVSVTDRCIVPFGKRPSCLRHTFRERDLPLVDRHPLVLARCLGKYVGVGHSAAVEPALPPADCRPLS